jgi:hypothetical protein
MRSAILNSKNLKTVSGTLLLILAAMSLYLLLQWLADLGGGSWQPASAARTFTRWLLAFWLPWVLLAPLVLCLRRFPFAKPRSRFIAVHLAGLLLLVLVHVALMMLLLGLGLSTGGVEAEAGLAYPEVARRFLFQDGYLLFDVLIFALMIASHILRQLQQQLRDREQEAFRLGKHLSDSRLQGLKMQLNPHFLFNTLNGLAVLIDKQDNARAREMLGELSSFLRQTLRNPKEKWVTLDQELDCVRQYLRIEQYRFGKRLTWFEDCEPLALSARMPPMLLQPLFENAIVHGLADKQGECRLGFECRLYDRYLIIMIFDNGDGFDETSDPLHKGGIGLSNVHARLQEIYGGHHSLQISKKADGTLVTLKLPSYKDSQF